MEKRTSINKIVILVFVLIATLVYDILLVDRYIEVNNLVPKKITTFATGLGHVTLCVNNAPTLNLSSPQNATIREEFLLYIHENDSDGHSLNFTINDTSLFNLTNLNSTTSLINFTPAVTDKGNYSYLISVNDSSGCSNQATSSVLELQISGNNSPPQFIKTIPNMTWWQGAGITNAFDLDDHFSDPDGETLNYSYSGGSDVTVTIDSFNRVSFSSAISFYGTDTIQFMANDSELTNTSNVVTLTIQATPNIVIGTPAVGGGGGGGGGGRYICLENWACSDWSRCYLENIRRRACIDLHNCGTNLTRPTEEDTCEYVPTCYDGIRNQGEEGIDCGGPCISCGTCFDGIKNQGESGVDCGGPCFPCGTCYDGIRNQGEEGIDCGGPCPRCEEKPAPISITKKEAATSIFLIILISILLLIPFSRLTYVQIKRMISKRTEKIILRIWKEGYKINRDIMIKHILNRLEYLQSTLSKDNATVVVSHLLSITKVFLREQFNLRYEFTSTELSKELASMKVNQSMVRAITSYFKYVDGMVYSHYVVDMVEMRTLIDEAKTIISLLTDISLDKKAYTVDHEDKLSIVHNKIRLSLDYLVKKELKKSRELYIDILNEYKKLSANDKRKVKLYIFRLYSLLHFGYKKWTKH